MASINTYIIVAKKGTTRDKTLNDHADIEILEHEICNKI